MKKILLYSFLVALMGCGANHQKNVDNANVMEYAQTITAQDLKDHLYTFAGDNFQGREAGEPGQKKAAEYLKANYKKMDIASPLGDDDYFQEVPASAFRKDGKPSENVLAFIKGTEKPEEVLVISSHYDHLGMDDQGNVYNGADDDGSGTVAVLEIAQAFANARKDGYAPKRTILFLNNTGEEKGLIGSKYYTDHPVFPMNQTITDLNIDMIGRTDVAHQGNDNYVYLIGSSMLSNELHDISEKVNSEYINLDLDYKYDDPNDPNRFYYRSDHYNFAKHNVPIIFYFNGVHADYHKITDTPDKIQYDLLAKRAQLIFLTAWAIANGDHRPALNSKEEEKASSK